jgi:predicted RNase H-like nuclease
LAAAQAEGEAQIQVRPCLSIASFAVGSETWALTRKQAERLEVAHSDCLRQILNVRRAGQHSKQHLWSQCGTVRLAAHLAAAHAEVAGSCVAHGRKLIPTLGAVLTRA